MNTGRTTTWSLAGDARYGSHEPQGLGYPWGSCCLGTGGDASGREGTLRPGPNRHDAVVIAVGDLWVVDGVERSAKLVLHAIETVFEVRDPEGWVFSRQGLALARFGPDGLMWHTGRLSWDGFDQLKVLGSEVMGLTWSPMDNRWYPFRVDLTTGRSTGGVFDEDREGWERLAE
jgi:hypothetical protein